VRPKANDSPVGLADEFFGPWEEEITSFEHFNDVLKRLYNRSPASQYAWRGVVNCSWPLHSSLYRRLLWTRDAGTTASRTDGTAPDERDLRREEREVLASVHRWELHHGPSGRLSTLAQLATLQHFGAPTRLIDVTVNAYIGLWFAVEPKFRNREQIYDDVDGRLFAIDVTERLINEDSERRSWEDRLSTPWEDLETVEWSSKTWAWRPATFTARIASQHGAFLFGGVPRTGLLVWPKGPGTDSEVWKIDDVRRCISVPLQIHKADPSAPGVGDAGQPAYTFRIRHSAKVDIRDRLQRLFGYSHLTMYPDYPGFADFGTPRLQESPP
jgi:hypothetical protein